MNKLNIEREAKQPKYVDIGDGFYVNKVGLDPNGNSCVWVSKGSGRAKKIQMGGTIPNKSDIMSDKLKFFQDKNDPDTKKSIEKIKEYYKKYLTKEKKAARKYPTQYDAQFLVDLMNAENSLSAAGTSSYTDAKGIINQISKLRLSKWDVVFGDKSPWSPVRDKKGKMKVKWNKDKAKQFGE
jgi:hypothetical protein